MAGMVAYLGRSALALLVGVTAWAAGGHAWAGEAPLHLEGSAAPEPWKRYRGWTSQTWPGYDNLVHLDRSPAPPAEGQMRPVPEGLTGDPGKGKTLAFDRRRGGGCVACHIMGPDTPELPGNAGPDLSEIGAAGHDDAYLFNKVWDARFNNPETPMPPWGAHGYFDEQEIVDMVAFLRTLTTPATFANPLDDPAQRPEPVEDRDWSDPFVNPAVDLIEEGEALFAAAGPGGQACSACHAAPEEAFKGWAAAMPRWEPRLDKVISVAEFVYRHARATTGAEWLMQGTENTAMTVYLTSLSNGEPVQVDITSEGARQAYERGEAFMSTKLGQANMACVDCHNTLAHTWLRGQFLGETAGQTPHFPLWRTSRNEVWDIRKRLQWCNVQVRADELPPDAAEYGEIELFITAASNGLPIEAPGIRH